MVGEGLFTLEERQSPPSMRYYEENKPVTPLKTVNRNVNELELRKMDLFDDPVTFIRQLSTVSLGTPEFTKFEKYVYRSRYLNTQECLELLKIHYNNVMTRYAPKVQTLVTKWRTEVSLSTLQQAGLFSSDHMKSVTVLLILGNYHNLEMEGMNTYLLNTMKLLYKAVTTARGDPVDRAHQFYTFLTKSEGMGRVVLLYMLLLSTYEKYLWFKEKELVEDEMHTVFTYMICCFVEEMLNEEGVEQKPQKMNLVPQLVSKTDMLERHISVVSFLLKLKVKVKNEQVLISCVKAFRSKLRSTTRSRSMLVWTSIMSVYLEEEEISAGSFKGPRCLFDEVGVNQNMIQFTHVVWALERSFKDPKLCKYVEDNLSISKFVSLFMFNAWKYIDELKDDLVNEILVLANMMLDTFPKTQSTLAKYLSQFQARDKEVGLNTTNYGESKLSTGVQKSMETLFNVALLGKSRLQMSAALFLSKLLAKEDVTRPLPRLNKVKYIQSLVELLGFTKHQEYMDYQKEGRGGEELYGDNLVKDMSKLTLMEGLIKYWWKEIGSYLLSKVDPQMLEYERKQEKYNTERQYEDKYFKLENLEKPYDKYKLMQYGEKQYDKYYKENEERNGVRGKEEVVLDKDVAEVFCYLKGKCVEVSNREGLLVKLSSGNVAEKMLSYETITGMGASTETVVMCAMAGMYAKYEVFEKLVNQYVAVKSSYKYTKEQLYNKKLKNYMMLLLDNMMRQYEEESDMKRQKFLRKVLKEKVVMMPEKEKERYEQMLKSLREYKWESEVMREEYEQLMRESENNKEENEKKLVKLKGEMVSMSERHKNELLKMKEVVNKTNVTLQHLENLVNTTKVENKTIKQENGRMMEEREGLKSEMATLKSKVVQQQRELEKIPMLMKENEYKLAQNKKLQTEIDRKLEELTQSNANVDKLCRMLICLGDKHKTLMENWEKEKETVKNMSYQLSHIKSKLERLESEIKEKEQVVADLSKCKNLNESELSRMREELMRREEMLSTANKKLSEFKEKTEHLTHTLQKKTNMISNLEHRQNELERELVQRRQQLSTIESAFHSRPL